MDAQIIIKDSHSKMHKAVDFVLHEFSTIHTGKASPTMVEMIKVEAYGSTVHLKELAAITTPDARTIQIQPWDKSVMQTIAKAIQVANIGLNPMLDSNVIRCPIPELSRERRQELVKTTHTMAEEGRVRLRSVRRDAIEALKKSEKAGLISEDDLKRLEKEVQKEIDHHTAEINKHLEAKEKELLKV